MGNQLKTIVFLGGLTALAVAAASAFAPSWAFAIAAVAVLCNAGMDFRSDRLVLRMHRARELSREEAPALQCLRDRSRPWARGHRRHVRSAAQLTT